MARDFSRSFYNSPAWQRSRASYIKKRQAIDGGLCERCHERIGDIVHHKTWLTEENINDSAISLSHTNLQYVCHYCHDIIHGNTAEEIPDAIQYTFTADGQIAPLQK